MKILKQYNTPKVKVTDFGTLTYTHEFMELYISARDEARVRAVIIPGIVVSSGSFIGNEGDAEIVKLDAADWAILSAATANKAAGEISLDDIGDMIKAKRKA